jgi:hypothetical protein
MDTRNTQLAKVVAYFETEIETTDMAKILLAVAKQYSYHICTLDDEERPLDVKENLYHLHALQAVLETA